MNNDKSYIATVRRKSHKDATAKVHYTARNISDATIMAEAAVDSLWEVIKVEILE